METTTDNEKLREFSNIPTSELQGKASYRENNTNPTVDIFNSAGNTTLSDEDTDEPKEEKTDTGEEKKTGKIKLGKVISGKNAVAMVNIFVPSFIVFAFRRAGYTTTKPQWKLNKEEQETLNPVVQDCLDFIIINFDNPFYALAFVASAIYGAKAFDAIPDLKKMKDDALTDMDIEANVPSKDEPITNSNNSSYYKDIRDKINSTSVRKQKNQIIIDALLEEKPTDLIEAGKVYLKIFPERTEGYFMQDWYRKNIDMMPEPLRFVVPGEAIEDFSLPANE